MTRTALAISPHLDDAIFSCAGTLNRLALSGWRVVVATVFTRSVANPTGFALACQLDKGLDNVVDYMALRRSEDQTACAILHCAAPIHLDFLEAPHRGYHSAPDLFGPPHDDDDLTPTLEPALKELVQTVQPALILAPQAIGGHVDHVQVVKALQPSLAPALWWRDFPYIVRSAEPAEPFHARFADLPVTAVSLDGADETIKLKACAAYASQIGFHFGNGAGLRRKLDAAGSTEVLSGTTPF